MRLDSMHSGSSEFVNLLEILGEHVWVLVILCRDVLLDGGSEGDVVGAPEGQREEVATRKLARGIFDRGKLTRTWRSRWGGGRNTQFGCLFTRRANFHDPFSVEGTE
jgi:hypothetical protein